MFKILIVDDELDISELFRQAFRKELKSKTFDLVFAVNAEQALHLLAQREPPDCVLVFSDINMPGMSGLELLPILQKRYPHLPVSVISAYSDDHHIGRAKALGARDYFTKPIDFERIRTCISSFLETA